MACFLSKTACLLLALCAAVAHVPGASAVGMKKKTLTLYQDPPRIVNGTYDSYTFYTYEAVLRSAEGGSAVGFLYGTSTFNSALNVNQVSWGGSRRPTHPPHLIAFSPHLMPCPVPYSPSRYASVVWSLTLERTAR